jgi:hypothetical protein
MKRLLASIFFILGTPSSSYAWSLSPQTADEVKFIAPCTFEEVAESFLLAGQWDHKTFPSEAQVFDRHASRKFTNSTWDNGSHTYLFVDLDGIRHIQKNPKYSTGTLRTLIGVPTLGRRSIEVRFHVKKGELEEVNQRIHILEDDKGIRVFVPEHDVTGFRHYDVDPERISTSDFLEVSFQSADHNVRGRARIQFVRGFNLELIIHNDRANEKKVSYWKTIPLD